MSGAVALPNDRLRPLSRHLAAGASPTVDLYVLAGLAGALADNRVQRLAPTVFRTGDTTIVCRHDGGMRHSGGSGRLIYVLDDDVWAGARDPALPLAYRAKLALLECRAADRLIPRSDLVLAASDALARVIRARFPAAPLDRIDPAWPEPRPPGDGPIRRIALLQAQSHRGDFGVAVPALDDALAAGPDLTVTISGNLAVPRHWSSHARVSVLPAMDWPRYRDWLRDARFDLALYPLCPTRFNAARSLNKLGEYALTGAAVLASEHWSGGQGAGDRWCPVPDGAEAWCLALRLLLDRPEIARTVARNNHAALHRAPSGTVQSALWARVLGPAARTSKTDCPA